LVATYTFVNPIIAVLLGWSFLGESFTAVTLIGGALIVAAIIGLLVFDQPDGGTDADRKKTASAPLGREAKRRAQGEVAQTAA
jgi:drug/metabolite transporter (DMT)-like permease